MIATEMTGCDGFISYEFMIPYSFGVVPFTRWKLNTKDTRLMQLSAMKHVKKALQKRRHGRDEHLVPGLPAEQKI
ncbi:MAG: hypothetical protein Q7T80_10565 [Methanoregula sp.]|nr:hypothetical protein [Methanoregula sp.]